MANPKMPSVVTTTSNPNEPPDPKAKVPFWRYPLEYLLLVRRNSLYRVYLFAHVCMHVGDWFVRIASLISVERLAPNSAKALSGLILAKMIPQALFSHVGGTMADTFDRRKLLVILDCIGGVLTWGFILAVAMDSLELFYLFSALRAAVHSLYEPTSKAIVPMLVADNQDLKRAMTMNGMGWSLTVILGGVLAGSLSAYLGVEICYSKFKTTIPTNLHMLPQVPFH